jgi:hypothetical protein
MFRGHLFWNTWKWTLYLNFQMSTTYRRGISYIVRKASKRISKFREFCLDSISSRNYKWFCCWHLTPYYFKFSKVGRHTNCWYYTYLLLFPSYTFMQYWVVFAELIWRSRFTCKQQLWYTNFTLIYAFSAHTKSKEYYLLGYSAV